MIGHQQLDAGADTLLKSAGKISHEFFLFRGAHAHALIGHPVQVRITLLSAPAIALILGVKIHSEKDPGEDQCDPHKGHDDDNRVNVALCHGVRAPVNPTSSGCLDAGSGETTRRRRLPQ